MSVTNKRSPALFSYSLGEEHLEHVNCHRYLGVTCNSQLRWTDHINNITHKANRTLGIVRRMLKPCDIAVKTKAYLTLIRPQLEYASAVWNPHDNKSVNKLEQVQKNAARFVTGTIFGQRWNRDVY